MATTDAMLRGGKVMVVYGLDRGDYAHVSGLAVAAAAAAAKHVVGG